MEKTHADETITEPVASEVNEVSEIEQLRARNAELEAENEAIKAKNEALEAENARFKKRIGKLTNEVTWRANALDEINKMTLDECKKDPFND